jgi:hypothetical protein
MSHTTTLKSVVIKDAGALISAINELAETVNCSLKENVKPRMYYSNQGEVCRYVLNLHEATYDVGFAEQADHTYTPVFDEFNNIVKNQIGASCPLPVKDGKTTPDEKAQHAIGKLMQLYAKHAIINEALNQGYSVDGTVVDEHGNLQVLLNCY